jgi:hypothetical protein
VTYVLVWTSSYGVEEIDECDTLAEAERLRDEYALAYSEGTVTIDERDERDEDDYDPPEYEEPTITIPGFGSFRL